MSRAGITVSIKGEITDLEAKITQSKEIINKATSDIINKNQELKDSQKSLNEVQKTYTKEIQSANKEIQNYLEVKSKNGKLSKEEQQSLAAARAELALYKSKTKELVDVEREKLALVKQSIEASKKTSEYQKIALNDIKEELDSKKKVLSFEKEYQTALRETNNAIDSKLQKQEEERNSLRNEVIQYTSIEKVITNYETKVAKLNDAVRRKIITTDEYTNSLKILNLELAKTTNVKQFGDSSGIISGTQIKSETSTLEKTEADKKYEKQKYQVVTSLLEQKRREEELNKVLADKAIQEKTEADKKYEKQKYNTVSSLLAQRRAEEANNQQLKETFDRTYKNTQAQNSYNDAVKHLNTLKTAGIISGNDFNTALKKEKDALVQADIAAQNKEKSTSNLANTTIRYLRWAGTIAGVVYAGKRAWDLTAGSGIAVNKIIENNTYGIAALISANTQMVDSLGKTLTPIEKFTKGQDHAKKVIAELRTESTKTAATFPQLLEIFQQGIGKTLSMGDAFGATTEEIEKNTIKLASRMSNFANAIGMPMDRVKEEMRSLVSGNASTDSLISTIIFGSPGEANKAIKEAETKVNGVADLLNKKFTPFDILAETKTFDKSVLAVQDSWSRAMGDMVEKSGAFKDITNIFYDMSKDITENTDDIVKGFDEFYKSAKNVVNLLSEPAGFIAVMGLATVATNVFVAAVVNNPLTAFAGSIILASEAAKDYIEKMRLGGKTQEEFNAQVKAQEDKWVSVDETHARITKNIQERTKRQQALQKSIAIYEGQGIDASKTKVELDKVTKEINDFNAALDSVNPYKQATEQVAKLAASEKEAGKLIANRKIDTERMKEDEKELLSLQGNIAKFKDDIAKKDKVRAELVVQLKKAEEAQAVAVKLNGQENISIASDIAIYKKDIQTQDKLIAENQRKINEENKKDADTTLSKSETLAAKEKEKNKQLAEETSIRAEIQMYLSGNIDTEQLAIEQQRIKIAGLNEEYAKLTDKALQEKVLLEILKEQYSYNDKIAKAAEKEQKQYKFDQISGSVKYGSMENLGQIYQELLVYYKEDPESLADLQTWVEREQNKLSKKPLVIDIKLQGWDEVSNSIATFGNNFQDINKAQKKYQQENAKVVKDEVALNQARVDLRDTTMSGIADMTGAVSSFYDEDDERRKKQLELQKVFFGAKMAMQVAELAQSTAFTSLFVAQETAKGATAGATAVAVAAQSSPFTGFATAAAMAALLASFGIMIGGKTKTSITSDAFSSQVANNGTGSVLGDTEAQSESITKALSILEDFASPQYETLQSMNKYLANISNNISGVSSLLIQSGGFAFGEGYSGFDTGYKNKLDVNSGIMGAINPLTITDKLLDSIGLDFLSGIGSGIVNSILGGVFGKKSVSQALTDSGIYFADTLLTSAIDQFNGQSYQTISTTVEKKSWFGSSSSTSVSSYFNELDSETERQFSLVLDNLYNTVLTAGIALDSASIDTAKSLDNFVVSIGKISLKDKTGTQIQDALKAIFGEIGDNITKTAFPLLTPFQQIGEGLFETMVRVSTGMESAEYYIGKLGKAFSDISYTDIVNKQGDVGFQVLLQSIVKADEASYGLNNNLVKIITSLDSTAEELYSTYTTLDTLRETFKFLQVNVDALSFSTIKGAGSVEALSSGVSAYIENFLTDEEKLAYSTTLLKKEFEKLNLAMPTSKKGFKDLLASIDKTTETGQELYGRLLILSEAFASVADESEKLHDETISRITDIQSAFLDLIGLIDTTINNLLGKQTGNNTTEGTISNYLEKRQQVDVLLSKGSNLTESEISSLNSLVSELASMASTIQSGFENNTAITGNLIQDLELVKSKINYTNQFVQKDLVSANANILTTGFYEGGYTGNGNKNEIAGVVHKNEYVITSDKLNAIGGVEAVKSMVQREIIQKNTNSSTSTIEYSNDKSGIINQLKAGQETLVKGFNAMLDKLEDIIDYNNERKEQSHSVTVTGSVTIEG